jgi:hypothetical protein
MRLMQKRVTEGTHPAWLREYREEQIANLKAKVGFCFRPIVLEDGYREGRPEAEGSCILVRLNGMRYLISAAHVLDEIKSRRTFVWTKHGMVELGGGVLLSTVPLETKVVPMENVDFAILALDDTLYREFDESDFLPEAEIDFYAKTKPDRVYVGIGFLSVLLNGESRRPPIICSTLHRPALVDLMF